MVFATDLALVYKGKNIYFYRDLCKPSSSSFLGYLCCKRTAESLRLLTIVRQSVNVHTSSNFFVERNSNHEFTFNAVFF
jgi:hypothetical protein